MFKIYNNTKLVQWNKGERLVMENLPVGADVLFYNEFHKDDPGITSVYEIEAEDGRMIRVCDIPNTIMAEGVRFKACFRPIVADAHGSLHSFAGKRECYFDVEPAERPEAYVDDSMPSNHSHSWDDLKDKPFYEESSIVDIISDVTVEFTNKWYSGEIPLNRSCSVGDSVVVIWNGQEYQCEVKECTVSMRTYVGNGKLFYHGNDETNEPFFISVDSIDCEIVTSEEIDTATFQVYKSDSTIKPLDEKFLPDHAHSWDDLVDKPFYEEDSVVDVWPEMTVTPDWTEDGTRGSVELDIEANAAVSFDDRVIVMFNGQEYITAVKYFGTTDWLYVGNGALLNDTLPETDEPFCITVSDVFGGKNPTTPAGSGKVRTTETGDVTFRVYKRETTVKTIDPKFLPTASGGYTGVYTFSGASMACDLSSDDDMSDMNAWCKQFYDRLFSGPVFVRMNEGSTTSSYFVGMSMVLGYKEADGMAYLLLPKDEQVYWYEMGNLSPYSSLS